MELWIFRKQRFALLHSAKFHGQLIDNFLLESTGPQAEYCAHLALDILIWLAANVRDKTQ